VGDPKSDDTDDLKSLKDASNARGDEIKRLTRKVEALGIRLDDVSSKEVQEG